MTSVLDKLNNLTYYQLKDLFQKHLEWSKENDRVSGSPKWFDEPGSINVIGIRCNSEVEFNHGKYNDYLIMIKNKTNERYDLNILKVTVDPATDKYGRAHLSQGVYDAYSVGIHGLSSGNVTTFIEGHGEIKRYCLRQERNKVYVTRTNGKGKVIKREWGFFAINIHNPDIYFDSSAACTITQTNKIWFEDFIPYVWDIESNHAACINHDAAVYCLINHSQLEKYLEESLQKDERADALNGTEGDSTGQAKSGTKLEGSGK